MITLSNDIVRTAVLKFEKLSHFLHTYNSLFAPVYCIFKVL